jgi:NTE family protein
VALGGGSARGYAHLGALACLERNGLRPDVIVGTSFGAVVGALYATGESIEALIARASAMRRRDVIPHVADFGLHHAALFRGRRLEEYLDRLLEGRTFADLRGELVVVTTDVDTGERVLLREGPLAPALRASASLPGVFAPVTIGGRRLIDGGIGSPVPLDTVVELGVDVALGIGAGLQARDSRSIRLAKRALAAEPVRKLHGRALMRRPRTAVGRLGRALALAADTWLRDDSEAEEGHVRAVGDGRFEVHTRPPISWLNFHRAGEAIAAGDEALRPVVPRLRRAVAAVLQGRVAAPVAVSVAGD